MEYGLVRIVKENGLTLGLTNSVDLLGFLHALPQCSR
jgi:hypothetical protein